MIKICITGPESCGKTTLALQLADHFSASLVKEYAREYLKQNGPQYDKSDLLQIAKGQVEMENAATSEIVICDTGLEVIQIWSESKFGNCDPWIEKQVLTANYDLYLLCHPDIPWVEDPLRENPADREELLTKYMDLLGRLQKPFESIVGSERERREKATSAINKMIGR